MYLGLDIGTSAVKAVVMSAVGEVVASASANLPISRPAPLWSEQFPNDWWEATNDAVGQLSKYASRILGIGLSGQMHGAVLLDARDQPLRPAILWNDGRSAAECQELEESVDIRSITGNCAMSGFTAPKLLWVRRHEPELFRRITRVLLPKDYVRLRMTGAYATDMSDASGTLWLDVAKRAWDDDMLAATHLQTNHMPQLFEGSDVTELLAADVAAHWHMQRVPVVGGAGDQAAGAIGSGATTPGRSTLSLGTSGVIFSPTDQYRANPNDGVHAFCHALPNSWHQMAVILSAASALAWLTQTLRAESEQELLDELEQTRKPDTSTFFLPYLSGERTPHNDAKAKGVFVGLDLSTTRSSLCYAVLEGVAFALRDCCEAMTKAGTDLSTIDVIGGGTRSLYWGQLIANVLQTPLVYREDAEVGPALGAARLAQLGTEGLAVNDVCRQAAINRAVEPDFEKAMFFEDRYQIFRKLYRDLHGTFNDMHELTMHSL